MKPSLSIAALAALLSAVPSTGAPAPDPAKAAAPKAADPNERICENIIATGSRIASRRYCAPRSEWEAKKRDDRAVIEQVQTRLNGPCSVINTHSGAPSC